MPNRTKHLCQLCGSAKNVKHVPHMRDQTNIYECEECRGKNGGK